MTQPHKHAALIKAWADGAEIEVQIGDAWLKAARPAWDLNTNYRIKPERVFPKSTMTPRQLWTAYTGVTSVPHREAAIMQMTRLANEAIKQYILEQETEILS